MTVVETIKHETAPLVVRIVVDDSPSNPRKEWDNLWTLVLSHRRYDLGDDHGLDLPGSSFEDDIKAAKESFGKDALVVPVWGYDHGSLALKAGDQTYPFSDPFDSGCAGFAIVSRAKIRECYQVSRVTLSIQATALQGLVGEVEVYTAYINGDVYGYEVVRLDEDGEETFDVLDSCYGYYGSEDAEQEARRALNDEAEALGAAVPA